MRKLVGLTGLVCLLGAGGCGPSEEVPDGGGIDAGGSDAPGSDDAPVAMDGGGPIEDCSGQADGTACIEPDTTGRFICLGEVCVVSQCGDGFADPEGEACDDANPFGGDGCEADCTFSCTEAADCPDDGDTCNGVPTCTAAHVCTATSVPDGTTCTIPDTEVEGVCRGGACRSGDCGDGDVDAGEDCDDGNAVAADGCEADCTFSCAGDGDCQNDTLCDGIEVCDLGTHVCASSDPLACDDEDPCTTDSCEAERGCVAETVLVDGDSDGFFAVTEACGGDDCDDANPMAFPGAAEVCGGEVDLNCDGSTDAPTWYADCDDDTYAGAGAPTMMSCDEPTTPALACRSRGGWTSRAPIGRAIDCATSVAAANPGQRSFFPTGYGVGSAEFDYDCNGVEEREFPTRPLIIAPCTATVRGDCTGTTYWDEARAPTCGGTATRSSCAALGRLCQRVTAEVTVRCR